MAIGLVLGRGSLDGERQGSASNTESLSIGFGQGPTPVLGSSLGGEFHVAPVDVGDSSASLLPLEPLPPAEALPYVTKEFDLCVWLWECEIATRVQTCENSSSDPWSISATGDYGIMQINRSTWEWWLNQRGFNFEAKWMIPERNVAMAFAIWEDHWWWEWSCF